MLGPRARLLDGPKFSGRVEVVGAEVAVLGRAADGAGVRATGVAAADMAADGTLLAAAMGWGREGEKAKARALAREVSLNPAPRHLSQSESSSDVMSSSTSMYMICDTL